jgi:hypothetical protein
LKHAELKPFNIIYLHTDCHTSENYGNYLQRVQRPCELWVGDHEFSISAVSIYRLDAWAKALEADLLVIIQTAAVPLEALVRQRRRLNRPTVYEINDDLAFVGNWLAADQGARSPLNRQHMLNLAHACDVLQVSSPGLAQRYRVLNAGIFVLDPYVPVPLIAPEKPSGFIIGWAGTTSHLDDLRIVIPTINNFLRTHPDCQFAAMGNLDMLQDLLRELPAEQIQMRAFGSYEALQDFLTGVHVAVASLQESGFNRGRSDGKFAQYAAAGCVALLSACEVFTVHKDRALLFATTQELENHLLHLYSQKGKLTEIARPGVEWVTQERSPTAVRKKMRTQFRHWLAGTTPLPKPAKPDNIGHAPQQRLWEEALQASKRGQHEVCTTVCQSILDMDAACHPARCLLLQQLNNLQHFTRMLDLIEAAPHDILYADYYASMGYAVARRIKPEKLPVFLTQIQSLAVKIQTLGVGAGGAEAYFRQILAEQPYHYFALFGLHKLLQKSYADSPEIQDLQQRMDLLAPDPLAAGKN